MGGAGLGAVPTPLTQNVGRVWGVCRGKGSDGPEGYRLSSNAYLKKGCGQWRGGGGGNTIGSKTRSDGVGSEILFPTFNLCGCLPRERGGGG